MKWFRPVSVLVYVGCPATAAHDEFAGRAFRDH